ncbi:MAG: hypothetical protein RR313_11285 [Anaerovoracaceae bacterium]
MDTFINTILEQIHYEKKSIGDIIDDRSYNRIPFNAYVIEYAKLDAIEEMIKTAFLQKA